MILCRLDYWLISNNLHDLTTSTDIIPATKTDNSAISFELNNNDNQIKGPGLWKMNCVLLEDYRYVDDIKSKIPVWLAEGFKDLSDNRNIWDWLKYNIRADAIQHSKQRAKERIEKENHLQEKYSKAKTEFERDPNNLNVDILNSAKKKFRIILRRKSGIIKGIIIRSRARWHEHDEKSTKHFLNLEKSSYQKNMRKLKISGSITTNTFNILSEQQRVYQGLYTSINKNMDATAKIESF